MLDEPRKLTSREKDDPFVFETVSENLKRDLPAVEKVLLKGFDRRSWKRMLRTSAVENPELYTEMAEGLRCLHRGRKQTRSGEEVGLRLRRIQKKLLKDYTCEYGFTPEDKRTQPVIVHLESPNVVTGLPKEIISFSDKLAEEHQTLRKWTFGWDNRQFVADLTMEQIERLRAARGVRDVEIPPTATILSNEYPVYNPAVVNTDWGVDRISPDEAWGNGNFGMASDGRRVKVAVLDTGIKSSHEAFWKSGICVYKGGYNFVAGNSNPADDHDHGTYCCGIVAAQHNGLAGSYRGVAPDIELYAVKVLDSKGSGSFANIAAGIDWARTNGMHVISMSLGGSSGSTGLQAACDAAWYAGILVIAAAGNSGPGDNTVGYPAKYQSVVAVAAIDRYENVASFSSRGPEVELSAPGRYIAGPWAGFTYDDYVITGSSNKYMCASGTSAACPHVSAAAALIKAWYWSATNTDMRQWLRDYARDL